MGIQIRRHGLRRRGSGRDWLGHVRLGVFHGSGTTARENDGQFPPAQRVVDRAGHHPALVWLVGFQRRLVVWSEPSCGDGVLEFQSVRHVRRGRLGPSGLPTGEEVVHGRLVLGSHLGPGGRNPGVRLHHTVGVDHTGRGDGNSVQLLHQKSVDRGNELHRR